MIGMDLGDMSRRSVLKYITAAGTATAITAVGAVYSVSALSKFLKEQLENMTDNAERRRFIKAMTPVVYTGDILYSPWGDSNQPSSLYSFAQLIENNAFGAPVVKTEARRFGGMELSYAKSLDNSFTKLEVKMYFIRAVEFRGTPERKNEAQVRIQTEDMVGAHPRIIRDSWLGPNELVFEEKLPSEEHPKNLPKELPYYRV